MPTIREVAKKAGVSKSTVSLVLNGKDNVAPDTRKKVLETFALLESQEENKNAPLAYDAERPTSKDNFSVVLLHPWWLPSRTFFKETVRGIQNAADELQINVRLADTHNLSVTDLKHHIYFSDPHLKPDGVLMFATHKTEVFIHALEAMGIPCALIGAPTTDPSIRTVATDEVEAGMLAAQHLIDYGHQEILFISDSFDFQYQRERVNGYINALRHAGLPYDDAYVIEIGYEDTMADGWHSKPSATAMITANEATLEKVIPHLKAEKISVPDDLSLVTFDDSYPAQYHKPPITAVAYPVYEQGYWAMHLINTQIKEPKLRRFDLTFGAELIVRNSCRKLGEG